MGEGFLRSLGLSLWSLGLCSPLCLSPFPGSEEICVASQSLAFFYFYLVLLPTPQTQASDSRDFGLPGLLCLSSALPSAGHCQVLS